MKDVPNDATLRLNLSWVLHERSDSAAVRATAQSCLRHRARLDRLPADAGRPVVVDEAAIGGVEDWLTASIGAPALLASALEMAMGRRVRSLVIVDDRRESPGTEVEFFRGPARLVLPGVAPCRVGVAALVVRPDGRTTHLVIPGVHDWPQDREHIMRSLECLVQAHAGQWLPRTALWDEPAENGLRGEVV